MDGHREFWRRRHRLIAAYLANLAWVNGADAVAIERSFLETNLELEKFKSKRITWLEDDFSPWFPYLETVVDNDNRSKIATFYFSRKVIKEIFPRGTSTTRERVASMDRSGVHFIMISDPMREFAQSNGWMVSDEQIVTELSKIAVGLSSLDLFKNTVIGK